VHPSFDTRPAGAPHEQNRRRVTEDFKEGVKVTAERVPNFAGRLRY
jgi:hypothetical protein